MTIIKTPAQMIRLLNKKFPKCNAVSTVEWDGTSGGIWFRGGTIENTGYDLDVIDMYGPDAMYPLGVLRVLNDFLTTHGWHGSPYDSGTLMAYR